MYARFFGLNESPFELTSNLRYLFLTPKHRAVLSTLQYGISSRKGTTLLVGEAGTGKTTLIRAALAAQRDESASCIYVSNPTLTREEFFEFLARGFSLGPLAAQSKTVFLAELERALRRQVDEGRVTALVIDEAQSLSYELLEEVRLLANMETDSGKLLPVVLAGQPELADRLNEPSLRQLKQRIALRCDLRPLDLRETAAYIAARLRSAGGDGRDVFTREAVVAIHEQSRGIPRTISVIGDNALINGFAVGRRPVGHDLVMEACRDLDFNQDPAPALADPITDAPERVAVPTAIPARPRDEASVRKTPELPSLFSQVNKRRRFSFF